MNMCQQRVHDDCSKLENVNEAIIIQQISLLGQGSFIYWQNILAIEL